MTETNGTSMTNLYFQSNANLYMGTGGDMHAVSFYASSDRRLKDNIKKLDLDPLKIINSIKLKEFNFKSQDDKENKHIGVIAQDLKKILPEKYQKNLVNDGDTLSINEGKIPYITMGAVQQLSKKIDKLEEENKELKDRLLKLEKLVANLS
jgi:hypothetical protein